MTKFFDGKKMIKISMYGLNGVDFSNDFFEVGGLEYDDDKDAYIVNDVDYLVAMAGDWEMRRGDFCDDESTDERIVDWSYV